MKYETKQKNTARMWDSFKQPNIHVTKVPDYEEMEKGETSEKIMAKIFPKFHKVINLET